MTFHGKPRADDETMHHVHESPWVMLIPLFVLAAGAAIAGYFAENYFVGDLRGAILEELDPGAAGARFDRRRRGCSPASFNSCR